MLDESWTVHVRHRGVEHTIELHPDESVADLQDRIYQGTAVPPHHQKLLARRIGGKLPDLARIVQKDFTQETSLREANLQNDASITLVGAPEAEVESLRTSESEWARRNGPRQLHPSLLRGAKPRSTSTPAFLSPFGRLHVHPGTPASHPYHAVILRYLERLATDPAVLHVCRLHDYHVGTLTELLPHEHANLLGLNENKGERILLRIRTDAADGMRDYKTSRRVLMHELAHNEVSDAAYPDI